LPNVVCDNYFAKLARLLASPMLLAAGPTEAVAGGTSAMQPQPARPVRRRQVRVYCKMREIDPNTGRNLIRRQLTGVREELEEEDDDDDGDDYSYNDQDGDQEGHKGHLAAAGQVLEFEFEPTPLGGRPVLAKTAARWGSPLDDNYDHDRRHAQNFGSFLFGQRKRPRPSSQAAAGQPTDDHDQELGCCELFIVHDSELLMHKSQLSVEAHLLARRLARLMNSNR
jgi:hypothetical protein